MSIISNIFNSVFKPQSSQPTRRYTFHQENGQYLIGTHDSFLRLGDVITGFSYFLPDFDDFVNKGNDFKLAVESKKYFVILTPCCSIEDKLITLVPLNRLNSNLIKNPFYSEDFTRINRPMEPLNAIPPDVLTKLPDEEKDNIASRGISYQLTEKFIYSDNDKLEEYQLSYKGINLITRTYWIDFKEAFTISSKLIQRSNPNNVSKLIQLSIRAREELRQKIAKFYSRIPDEDIVP